MLRKLASSLGLLAFAVSAVWAQSASIAVDLTAAGKPISPVLWGIFFEEINHAGDGGIYAELVRNRSFEERDTPVGWNLLEGSERARMSIDTSMPLNAVNRRSLRVDVGEGTGVVRIANEGYWGIGVRRGERYRLSVYARCAPGFSGELGVSIIGSDGAVLAQQTLRGITGTWKQLQTTLTSRGTDGKARLVLTINTPGTVWLDMVSLMPVETFKRRPNGLRRDLAQMLADLKPSFVRFPGGCFVEGDRMANALRWRDTVGDIVQRPPRWCVWGYQTTQGLGLHEYLQMSEDLGAEPMLVVNCGMACQFRRGDVVPMDQLDEWIEDALFAIEYAIGDVSTPAGAMRARNGHPKPFPLRFVEVGNENSGPQYEERYARFYDAIKARYPQIQIISNVPVRSRPADIIDEHYYSSPEWFISQADRYDTYDRNGAKIFVGEYAVTSGAGQGNLRAAIAEAAFMTGIERNSDVVVLAAYAPLFVNVNDRAWNPDLIGFDSLRVYGTPSYYVQKLFSRYRGTHVLPTQVRSPVLPASIQSGSIGVGTWQTQSEYRDIRVTAPDGRVLYESDFSQGTAGWRVFRGNWRVENGALQQTSADADCRIVLSDFRAQDYTLSLKARKLGGAEGFLIMFRVRDNGNWYWWNIGGWGNREHAIERSIGGGKSIVGERVPGSVETGRWYDVRIEVRGSRIRCYLDGQLVHDVQDVAGRAVHAVASRNSRTGEIILKVVNASDQPVDTEFDLQGSRQLASQGTLVVLTGSSPDDENSLQEPTRVAPVQKRLTGLSNRFRQTLPAHSLSVYILKEAR